MKAATFEALEEAEERGEMKRQDDRQRDLDDAHEAERALFEGKEARRQGARAGMNPYNIFAPGYDAWSRGWSTVDAQITAEELAKRPRLCCQPCTCGGRGMCLADAA